MKHIRLYFLIVLIIFVAILNHHYGWSGIFANPEQMAIFQTALQQNFGYAFIIYQVITIIGCVVFALPGMVFAISAGIIFGPFWGTIACSIATTIGAVLAFLVGRYFLQDSIKPIVMKNKHLRKLLYEDSAKSSLYLLLITRLIPLFPYNLQNFAYGITEIRLLPYTIYSLLFMLPGTAAYTIAAAGITNSEHRFKYFVIGATLLVLVIIIAFLLHKYMLARENTHD